MGVLVGYREGGIGWIDTDVADAELDSLFSIKNLTARRLTEGYTWEILGYYPEARHLEDVAPNGDVNGYCAYLRQQLELRDKEQDDGDINSQVI